MGKPLPPKRAIYQLSQPKRLTDHNLLRKYDSAAKISPTGLEDFYFEAEMHNQGKTCSQRAFPYDVFIYDQNGLLFPTNCFIAGSSDGVSVKEYQFSPYDFLSQMKISAAEDNGTIGHRIPLRWRSRNLTDYALRCSGTYCASGQGISSLKGGVCSVDQPNHSGMSRRREREPDPFCRSNDIECEYVKLDYSGIYKADLCFNDTPSQIMVCESGEHLSPQEPINIGRGAHDFAFIDGYLIYTKSERIWAMQSEPQSEPQACIPREPRQCAQPDGLKQFAIKLPEQDEGINVIDVSEGAYDYYPHYQEDGTLIFQHQGTKMRFPLPGKHRLLVLADGERNEAGGLLRDFLADPYHRVFEGLYSGSADGSSQDNVGVWYETEVVERKSWPWWSHISTNISIGGLPEQYLLLDVGVDYFPISFGGGDVLPFIGFNFGFMTHLYEDSPKQFHLGLIGLDIGLRSYLLSVAGDGIVFLDEVGCKWLWNPGEPTDERHIFMPYVGLIDFMIFSIDLVYHFDTEFEDGISVIGGFDLANVFRLLAKSHKAKTWYERERVRRETEVRDRGPNPVEEAEDMFDW